MGPKITSKQHECAHAQTEKEEEDREGGREGEREREREREREMIIKDMQLHITNYIIF